MERLEILNDLAAVFRWTAKLNMHEGIANHYSVCAPDSNEDFILMEQECISAISKQAILFLLNKKKLKK